MKLEENAGNIGRVLVRLVECWLNIISCFSSVLLLCVWQLKDKVQAHQCPLRCSQSIERELHGDMVSCVLARVAEVQVMVVAGKTPEADSASTLTFDGALVLVARVPSTPCNVTLRSRFGKHAV